MTNPLENYILDIVFRQPQSFLDLSDSKKESCKISDDLCVFGDFERFFVRGVLELPIQGTAEVFGWGMWVEIEQDDYENMIEKWEKDMSNEEPFSGRLDTIPPGYETDLKYEVSIQLQDKDTRPFFALKSNNSKLYLEQQNGITIERVAELNSFIGT